MSAPAVSVVIPVYNAEKYIAACLRSVLAQTFPDFEILVVDDGTPDGSMMIVNTFGDPRIRLIHQKNRGLAGARNTGIRLARGRYVALLDADDCWRPQKLACHVAHLEAHPKIGVSFSRSEFMDAEGQPQQTYLLPKLTGITVDDLLCANPVGNGSAPVFRQEVFDAIGFVSPFVGHSEMQFFDETFRRAEDYECWVRIAYKTRWQFEGISAPLTLYRINTGGLSASLESQFSATEQALEKIGSYAPDLIRRSGRMARACNAKYIARTALRQGRSREAMDYIFKAVTGDWRLLAKEPRSTLSITAMALLMQFVPERYLELVERLAQAGIPNLLAHQRIQNGLGGRFQEPMPTGNIW